MFELRFRLSDLQFWSSVYDYPGESDIELMAATSIRTRGYVTQDELIKLCDWKSPRIRTRCAQNEISFVEEVTKIALSTPNERLRIETLTLLKGVGWPTASVILHWCHEDPYPILDFRALWSLGVDDPPQYNFEFWWLYTQHCRKLASQADVSMRVLDRALWAYSKEKQGKISPTSCYKRNA